jgi:hypothetical protein
VVVRLRTLWDLERECEVALADALFADTGPAEHRFGGLTVAHESLAQSAYRRPTFTARLASACKKKPMRFGKTSIRPGGDPKHDGEDERLSGDAGAAIGPHT